MNNDNTGVWWNCVRLLIMYVITFRITRFYVIERQKTINQVVLLNFKVLCHFELRSYKKKRSNIKLSISHSKQPISLNWLLPIFVLSIHHHVVSLLLTFCSIKSNNKQRPLYNCANNIVHEIRFSPVPFQHIAPSSSRLFEYGKCSGTREFFFRVIAHQR